MNADVERAVVESEPWELWYIAVYDPATGCASRIVGVVGVDRLTSSRAVRFVPSDPGQSLWLQTLDVDPFADLAAIEASAWAERANGTTFGVFEVPVVPDAADLEGAVAIALTAVLVA